MRPNPMTNRRGANLLLLAVSIVALMGMAALAIDLAMLQKVRAEAQRSADAAALAGASAFLLDLGVAAETLEAGHRARQLADTNYMAGIKIDSLTELTVWAIPDSQKVRVLVRRANVPTWFARIFGRTGFPVGARAAAIADYAGGTTCVKPIAIPDLWDDVGQDANGDNAPEGESWMWEPGAGDTYQQPNLDTGTGTGYGSNARNGTGTSRDWGRRIVLRDQGNMGNNACLDDEGNKCLMPGWWGLWKLPGDNFPDVRAALRSCRDTTFYVNTPYPTETGEKGALSHDLRDIFRADPNAVWSPTALDTVSGKTGSFVGISSTYGSWRRSPRAWVMGLFDPANAPSKANATLRFNNFFLFFFEGCLDNSGNITDNCGPQTDLVGRFVGIAQGTGPGNATLTRLLRLVE